MEQLVRIKPELVCKDLAVTNEVRWQKALTRGCLSKAVNDKDILYSHLKALSGWQFGRSNLFPDLPSETDADSQFRDDDLGQWEEEYDVGKLEEAEAKFQPVLRSPVILEDLTRPPQDIEDATPALFTLHQFLNYLRSSDWSDSVRLRVVGGELLNILNSSLLNLERRRLVDPHSVHALANNRVKVKDQGLGKMAVGGSGEEELGHEQKTAGGNGASWLEEPVKDKVKLKTKKNKPIDTEGQDYENKASDGDLQLTKGDSNRAAVTERKIEFPMSYQTDLEFDYEKLSIEIVFYDKCARSNIPYIEEELDGLEYDEDLPDPKTLPKQLSREPYSHKEYRLDKVRCPSDENINPQDYIAHLEQEILKLTEQNVVTQEESEKPKAPAKGKGKEGPSREENEQKEGLTQEEQAQLKAIAMKIPDIEYIAEDPYLEPTGGTESASDVVKKSQEKQQTSRAATGPKDESRKSSNAIRQSMNMGSREFSKPPSIANLIPDSEIPTIAPSRSLSEKSVQSSSHSLMNVSGTNSSTIGSLVSVWEPQDSQGSEKSTPVWQRLNLRNNELYVSSLYTAREENKQATETKLEDRKRLRAKECAETAQRSFQAAVERAKGDLYSSFKHLAKKKEAVRRLSTAPNVKHLKLAAARAAQTNNTSLGSEKSAPKNKSALPNTAPSQVKATNPQTNPKLGGAMKGLQLPESQVGFESQKPLPPIMPSQLHFQPKKPTQEKALSKAKAMEWESYRKKEDRSEMEYALKNDLERGLLHRMMLSSKEAPRSNKKAEDLNPVKDKGKTRSEKNKSQNKMYNKNDNWVRLRDSHQARGSFRNYDLFLSAYGTAMKITDPNVKDNIITGSFCVNRSGASREVKQNPGVRRIGFTTPDHLMKYLISVRSALQDDTSLVSWRPIEIGQERPKERDSKVVGQNTQSIYASQRRVPKPLQQFVDANNNGPVSDRPMLHQSQSRNSPAESRGGKSKMKIYHRSQRANYDRNRSAASDTMLSPRGAASADAPGNRMSMAAAEAPETNNGLMPAETHRTSKWMASADVHGVHGIPETTEPSSRGRLNAEEEFESEHDAEDSIDISMSISEFMEPSYLGSCNCQECECQYSYLAHLMPTGNYLTALHGCPPILGRLRRDYRFLQKKPNRTGQLDSTGRVKLLERPPVLGVIQIGEDLLKLMDDVMIRKEILCSSRGFTYITITFTKLDPKARVVGKVSPRHILKKSGFSESLLSGRRYSKGCN